jgi:hypothetical protein
LGEKAQFSYNCDKLLHSVIPDSIHLQDPGEIM